MNCLSYFSAVRCLESYADVIVMRHPQKGSAQEAANVSSVPIINAGDGIGEHPTQVCSLDWVSVLFSTFYLGGLALGLALGNPVPLVDYWSIGIPRCVYLLAFVMCTALHSLKVCRWASDSLR